MLRERNAIRKPRDKPRVATWGHLETSWFDHTILDIESACKMYRLLCLHWTDNYSEDKQLNRNRQQTFWRYFLPKSGISIFCQWEKTINSMLPHLSYITLPSTCCCYSTRDKPLPTTPTISMSSQPSHPLLIAISTTAILTSSLMSQWLSSIIIDTVV